MTRSGVRSSLAPPNTRTRPGRPPGLVRFGRRRHLRSSVPTLEGNAMALRTGIVFALLLGASSLAPAAPRVAPDDGTAPVAPAPLAIGGRTVARDAGLAWQRPGCYFDTAFDGTDVWIYRTQAPSSLALY